MTDTLRVLVHELVDEWTDRDGQQQRGLVHLIGDDDELLPGQGAREEGGGHRKISGSPAPWDGIMGPLLLDIHATARDLRDRLFMLLFGHRAPELGVSNRCTILALEALPALAEAAEARFPSSSLPRNAEKELAGWVRRAREALLIDVPTIPIGSCPVLLEDEEGNPAPCGHPLRANPVHLRDVVCWNCGARWPREQWLLLGATISDTA